MPKKNVTRKNETESEVCERLDSIHWIHGLWVEINNLETISSKAFTRPSLISEPNSIRRIFKTLRYFVLPQTTTPVPPNTFDLVCNKIKMFSDFYCTLYSSAYGC